MHEVKIIIADARQVAACGDEIIGVISRYYAQQYQRIKKKQEADQELTAGFLLKKYLGVISNDQIIRTEYGKPMLRSGNAFFNLSHSGEYVVLAVADMEIGVDVETILDVHWPTVNKIFSKKQKVELELTAASGQPIQFTRLWTECEAVLKLVGTGLGVKSVIENTPVIHHISSSNIIISCAAYEEFYITVKKEQAEIRL